MGLLTDDQLAGACDLRSKEVELEALDGSVIVRGLGAAFSLEAQSEAVEMKTIGNTQIASINTRLLEETQLVHGIQTPKMTRDQVRKFMENNGPSVRTIVEAIDELSGIDKDAIEDANARFQGGGDGEVDEGAAELHEATAGNGRSDIPARVG